MADRLRGCGGMRGGLLSALGAHASWTSSATHALLPLLATDPSIAVQVQTGIASHRRRFGDWRGGFWLPECGYAPWLGALLEEAGVRATCVELTGRFGLGDARHLRPLQTDDGPVLWPIDRQTIALVWGGDGYPSGARYRNYHGLTEHHHRVWRNDGAPYDHVVGAYAGTGRRGRFRGSSRCASERGRRVRVRVRHRVARTLVVRGRELAERGDRGVPSARGSRSPRWMRRSRTTSRCLRRPISA